MRNKIGVVLLLLAASIAILTAVAHLSCIFLGAQCYEAQMAPLIIVQSAQAGTLLAPLATVVIAAVFILLGCYALSGARLIKQLPLLSVGIYAISAVCILRGILPIQLWFRHPNKVTAVVLAIGLAWLFVGLCYLLGYKALKPNRLQPK